jgi:C4-dicarboxylate transporter, DctM subunit
MPAELIGLIGLIVLLFLLCLGVPIGLNLLIVGFVGLCVLIGFHATAPLLAERPYSELASFSWVVLPLFLLMGEFALYGGIGEDAFNAGFKWFGKLPGGLAIATTVGCTLFGAVSGSSLAANTLFSKVALPEMLKHNYDVKLSVGCIAAAGTLAILIPPSSVLVIYGMLSQSSIAKVLMGGYLPGLLTAFMYIITIILLVKTNNKLAPQSNVTYSWKEKFSSLTGLWAIVIIIVLMVGGIFAGIFTASEGAAFGALATFIVVLVRKKLSLSKLKNSLISTVSVTGMIFIILIGVSVFTKFMAVSQITAGLGGVLTQLSPVQLIILYCFVMAILGMFLDPIGMMCLALPLFLPVVHQLGISEVWFGILTVTTLELGGISPPFGLNIFAMRAVTKDLVSLEDAFRGVVPFVVAEVVTIALLIAFPAISTVLPNLMMQ